MISDGNPLMAHIARLHYVHGLTKQEIGARLGLNRFKVARLLDQAREQGIVRFEIADPVPIDDAASEALVGTFGLDLGVVVSDVGDPTALATVAAAWIPEILPGDEPVGVAWGATLQQVVELLPRLDSGRPVVQICGAIPGLEPGTGPTELAMRFAERLGGALFPLAAPALTGRAARRELLDNDVLRPTLRQFDRVGAALVGIGKGENFPGAPSDAAGHILVHVFDEYGRSVAAMHETPAIAMSRKQLEQARVVAIAGGAGKEQAILGALRSGMVDVLITDSGRARYALEAAAREHIQPG